MPSISLPKPVVIAIASAFTLLLVGLFWWKLTPQVDQRRYQGDAIKIQEQEAAILVDEKGKPVGVAPAAIPSDKAYQPESGAN